MEGATGVTGIDDISSGRPSYERFRKFLTKDVNAAIEGAIGGGATTIVVNEAHGPMRNILLEELNPKAKMISGNTKPLGMMEGINESFDAAFFIGYHARAGTQAAVINHTISLNVSDFRINDRSIGELGMNAYTAGYFKVPVVLVTGDDKACIEGRELIKNIETVIVKEGIDQLTAKCLPPATTFQMIKESAKKALENLSSHKSIKCEAPANVEIDFLITLMAATASIIPIVKRKGPKTVAFKMDDYLDAMKMSRAVIRLSRMNQVITL